MIHAGWQQLRLADSRGRRMTKIARLLQTATQGGLWLAVTAGDARAVRRIPDLVGDDPDALGMHTRVQTGLIPIDAGHCRAAALKHEHEHRRCRVRRR